MLMARFTFNVENVDPDKAKIELVFLVNEEPLDIALLQTDGSALFSVPDDLDVAECDLVIESPAVGRHVLTSTEVADRVVTVASLDALTPPRLQPAGNDHLERPLRPPAYPGRMTSLSVQWSPRVAGRPREGQLPTNQVAERYSARYLDVTDDLYDPPVPGDSGPQSASWKQGVLVEYEITWEPLGWALDDWLHTRPLAPHEDSVGQESSALRTGDDRRQTAASDEGRSAVADQSATTSAEIMRTVTDAMSSNRGLHAGFGGGQSRSASLSIDPVLALTNAVTGTLQLGYSSGSAQAEVGHQARAERRLQQEMERIIKQTRQTAASSLTGTRAELESNRSLHAVRNLTQGSSLNLGVFSISRQWLVTTVVANHVPVVLVPIFDGEREFEEVEVFTHRTELDAALLDESLRPTLAAVAEDYSPPNAPQLTEPAASLIKNITGLVRFSDEAKGRDSNIKLELLFRGDDDTEVPYPVTFDETAPGHQETIDLAVNRPRSRFAGIALVFNNPGPVSDTTAIVDRLLLTAHTQEGTSFPLWEASDPIVLQANQRKTLGWQVPPPPTGGQTRRSTTRDVARVLAHLNAHKSYYRLAIDLQKDSVTRFRDLAASKDDGFDIPTDLEPVGVAGAHLAFVAGDAEEPATDARTIFQTFASTPSGGMFMEAIPGAHADSTESKSAPQLAVKDGTYSWPGIIELEPTDATSPPQPSAPSEPASASAPTAPASALPAFDGAAVITALGTLAAQGETDALTKSATALADAIKALTPKQSEASEGTSEESDDGTAGGSTTSDSSTEPAPVADNTTTETTS
jgi:hypothetical protein